MKKILGLDIGTNSIGWAIIEATNEKPLNSKAVSDINNDRTAIHEDAVGVRIIPQEEEQRFLEGKRLNDPKGTTLTKTATRRKYRGTRRRKSRYKLRRDKLLSVLQMLGMKPEGSQNYVADKKRWVSDAEQGKWYNKTKGKTEINLGAELYKLRDQASKEPINLREWGRILLHLNQLRGYSSDRFKKDEKPEVDYYTGEVVELVPFPNKTDFEDKDKKIVKWLHYYVKLKMQEPIIIHEAKHTKVDGWIFVKEAKQITFNTGEIITFKLFERTEKDKKNKTVKNYFQIRYVEPDETDWNFKYQKLNKSLAEYCENGNTVGSFFYKNYYEQNNIKRIRNNVVNRNWYEDEFEAIWKQQYPHHRKELEKTSIDVILEHVFKDENIKKEVKLKPTFEEQLYYLLKEKIIYFQRPWQQSKNKAECRFEKIEVEKERININTRQKEKYKTHEGRKVIPRSHPLHQDFKIWQQINNVRLWHVQNGFKIELFGDPVQFRKQTGKDISMVKQALYDELQIKKSVSWKSFVKENLRLNLKENKAGEYYEVNFIKKSKSGEWQDNPLKGNTTKIELRKILADKTDEWFDSLHKDTNKKRIEKLQDSNKSKSCKTPITNFQLLWEIIYDITITSQVKVKEILKKHFGFAPEICDALSKITFDDSGMGNLSAKAIRRLLPLMRDGNSWNVDDLNNISNWKSKNSEKGKIQQLLSLTKSEEEKTNSDEDVLSSLKEFLPDKNARRRLAQFKNIDDFKGLNYWEAAAIVYGQHSKQGQHSSKIKENAGELLQPVRHNSMNNPVVERIVNETLAVVKLIFQKYGFDEVRIELSRELKASMQEREQMWEGMLNNQKRNELAKAMLREMQEETGSKNIDKIKIYEDIVKQLHSDEYVNIAKEFNMNDPTKADIKKYLMWLDQKCQCPYTGEIISFTALFKSGIYDVDHIVSKERYFDNAYSNKVICRKTVNKDMKGSMLPYEFLKVKRGTEDRVKDESGNFILINGEPLRLLTWDLYEEHVKKLFPKGKKLSNLLRKDIPEDPLERQLKETQYINKKLKEELSRVVGFDKVWTTTGSVTDLLRESWHLNNVMKEMMRNRFEKFKLPIVKKKRNNEEENDTGDNSKSKIIDLIKRKIDKHTGEVSEIFPGFSKRLDHRHHALDAIIIACTKQGHIQYINNLNTQYTANQNNEQESKNKYALLRKELCEGDKRTKFKTPWAENLFIPQVKNALENLVISHKNAKVLISPTKHNIPNNTIHQKTASIRGALHKETNYAKRNYFETGTQIDIKKVIDKILREKAENNNQTLVLPKSLLAIIKETVLKEKYQQALYKHFEAYENQTINQENKNEIAKKILDSIKKDISLNHLEWLSVYSDKRSSARPNGLSMNLNDPKELKSIADQRIKRLAIFRLDYINKKKEQIKNDSTLSKDIREISLRQLEQLPLYSNALYEIKVKTGNSFKWIFLNQITADDINRIDYGKGNEDKTSAVRQALQERLTAFNYNLLKSFTNIFEDPIFITERKIPINKVRQKTWFQELYEVTPKRYVYSLDTFMLYVFQHKETKMRDLKFLKFIDAVKLIHNIPDRIVYHELLKHENPDYELIFTLQKNDLIYLPEESEMTDNIQFTKINEISEKLFVVKDINPSQKKILVQQHTTADEIELNEADTQYYFSELNLSSIKEEIKSGNSNTAVNCIKLFSDRLGKKIVPYWQFPNGSWNKDTAKQLGLI